MKRRSALAAIAALSTAAVMPALPAHAAGNGKSVLANSGKLTSSALKVDGAAAAGTPMSVTLQLPLRNAALAQSMIDRGQSVTPAEYAAKFAPTAASVSKVAGWAKSQGFSVKYSSVNGAQVEVSGDVAKVNKTFGVTMHKASLHGVRGLSVDKAPSVPSDLGISGIAGLNTVHRVTPNSTALDGSSRSTVAPAKKSKNPATDGSTDCANYWGDHLLPSAKKYANESNYICGYLPADLQKMYGVQDAKGLKPTLGILLWGGDTDIQKTTNDYMTAAGYPALTDYQGVIEPADAGMADCGPYDIQGEQALDVQSTHAIAPNAAIRYYGAASCYDADLTAEMQKMIDAHKVTTISMSFGMPYDDGMTAADMAAWDRPLQQAALTGISTFASSGDDGNNSTSNDLGAGGTPDGKPHIGYPASSAYTTAVGGTSVGMLANGQTPVNAGWEDQFYSQPDASKSQFSVLTTHPIYGAGGGVSAVSKQPSWQKGVVTTSTTMRAVPDVAAIADPYTGYTLRFRSYTLDDNGNPTGSEVGYATYGGTSLASPVTAAIVGLAKAYNHSTAGLAAPKLYKMRHSAAITDINQANKAGLWFKSSVWGQEVVALDGKPENLVSAKGWDNVTGVGSPNGMKFIRAFK